MKKFFAILFTILIFSLSFCLPAFALTVDTSASGTQLKPLYNLQSIELTMVDGSHMLFEIPLDWYSNSDEIQNIVISLNGVNDEQYFLNFANISVVDFGNYYRLNFTLSIYKCSSIVLHYNSSFIPYSTLGGSDFDFPPVLLEKQSYLSTSGSFTSKGILFDPGGTVEGSSIPSPSRLMYRGVDYLTFSDLENDNGSFLLSPGDDFIQNSYDIMHSNGLYLNGSLNTINIVPFDVIVNSTSNGSSVFDFSIPLIEVDTSGSSAEDYLFSNLYLLNAGVPVEYGGLGEFLAVSLDSFLSFEFAPGFSLGALFIAIVGLLSVIAFLKWFAGG